MRQSVGGGRGIALCAALVCAALAFSAVASAGPMLGPKTDFATGTAPVSVASGDFNKDGHEDLAVANHNANSVSVLLGQRNGSFGTKTDFTTGTTPSPSPAPTSTATGARTWRSRTRLEHRLGPARPGQRLVRGEDRLHNGGGPHLRRHRRLQPGRARGPRGREPELEQRLGPPRPGQRLVRGEDRLRDGHGPLLRRHRRLQRGRARGPRDRELRLEQRLGPARPGQRLVRGED